MASLRLLVSATNADVLADQIIRKITVPSIVNLWASCVTVTDTIGLTWGPLAAQILAQGTMNIRAAAVGLVHVNEDQLLFNSLLGVGELQMPVNTLTTSLIFILSVEPA